MAIGSILTSSNTSDWSPTLPNVFHGLFTRWIRERNINALGSVPCRLLSLKRPVITFLNAFSQRLSKLRNSFVPSTRRVRPAAKRCESLHANTLFSTLLLICSTAIFVRFKRQSTTRDRLEMCTFIHRNFYKKMNLLYLAMAPGFLCTHLEQQQTIKHV